jgi:hypothetical protein
LDHENLKSTMATHFDPYPDDDEAEQAPCGTWLGAAHEASEAAIVEQMGDMAVYMRAVENTTTDDQPK